MKRQSTAQKTIKEIKRQSVEGEKKFINHISNKRL